MHSGRGFSPWEGSLIESPIFAIAMAVVAVVDAHADEDLVQADTGLP